MLTLLLSLLVPLAAGEAEPACLLQKPKAPTQLSLLADPPVAVVGWDFASEYAGKGDCGGYLDDVTEANPTSCASRCESLSPQPLAYSFDEVSRRCGCCRGLILGPNTFSLVFARAVPLWHFLTVGKTCVDVPVFTSQAFTLNDCGLICESQITEGWFIYKEIGQTCECCSGLDTTLRLADVPGFAGEKIWVYRKEDVPGWDYAGKGICLLLASTHQSIPSLQECSKACASDSSTPEPNSFEYDLSRRTCQCCFGLFVLGSTSPIFAPASTQQRPLVYVKADPFWKFLADFQKCVTPVATSFLNTLADCAKSCEPSVGKWLVYGQDINQCDCCGDDGVAPADYGGLGYHLAPLTFPEVPGWRFEGRRLDCDGPSLAEFALAASPPSACGEFCASQPFPVGGMVIDQNFPAIADATCKCCGSLSPEDSSRPVVLSGSILRSNPSSGAYGYLRDAGVGVYGDPHITALDGSHYLLLSQGTFSLWHLHGLSTEFQAHDGFKKVPVEWEILTHYSGHQSFTKGLLLVDRSAGVQRQVLEITSADCQWRARSGAEWSMVSKAGMISVADGQDFVTGFKITKAHGNKHGGGHASESQLKLNQVHLSMNSKDGATDIAVLTVSCRPKRNLNLNLVMKRRSDHRLVEGELAGGQKLAALETDSKFNIKGKWQDVGGSDEAAAYLRQMDEGSNAPQLSLLQSCNAEEKAEAKITCSKYLDSLGHLDPSGFFFNDCVYDVCHGAGEVAAELAAELLTSASV